MRTLSEGDFLGSSHATCVDFFNRQHMYCPVIINQFEYVAVPPWQPLPFIASERRILKSDNRGTVTREVVAAYQFQGPDPFGAVKTFRVSHEVLFYTSKTLIGVKCDFPVARKRFRTIDNLETKTKELSRLASLVCRHDRITKPHAFFISTGGEQNHEAFSELDILLPIADTSLRTLLYDRRFEDQSSNITDLLLEARNIADALAFLHRTHTIDDDVMSFCCGNLKLENILVNDLLDPRFPVGSWRISFSNVLGVAVEDDNLRVNRLGKSPAGTSEIISDDSTPIGLLSRAQYPGVFSAPEIHANDMIGAPSDIWSFGCILFQILVRGVGGISQRKKNILSLNL